MANIGDRFERLTIIGIHSKRYNGIKWTCRCDCGTEKAVFNSALTMGKTKSCGCLRKEASTHRAMKHGDFGSAEYIAWCSMKRRCNSPSAKKYSNYGGRGISVCERWDKYENFLADMGRRPSLEHSIDRIDNNGNYEPGNCRWATRSEQILNRRVACLVEIDGVVKNMTVWAREFGLRPGLVSQRLKNGWDPKRALLTPVQSQYARHQNAPASATNISRPSNLQE